MDKAEFNFDDFTFDVNINNNITVYGLVSVFTVSNM